MTFTYVRDNCKSLLDVKNTFFPFFCCSVYFLISYLYIVFLILLKDRFKLNRSKFYLIYTSSALILFLIFIHRGEIYHQFMFFVFLIISLWISEIEFNKKAIKILLYITLFKILYTGFNLGFCNGVTEYKKLGEEIVANKEFSNSIFFLTTMELRYELMPYIYTHSTDRYDLYSDKISKNTNMVGDFFVDNNTKNILYDFASKTNKKVFLLNDNDDLIAKDVEFPHPIERYGIKIYRIK